MYIVRNSTERILQNLGLSPTAAALFNIAIGLSTAIPSVVKAVKVIKAGGKTTKPVVGIRANQGGWIEVAGVVIRDINGKVY